jgi:ATP-dependent protease HslVU (ClpYQ) peptidase subunit
MTTIAACFSKKEIAADSMVSLDAAHYSVIKLRKGASSVFGAAGEWDACLKFLAALETNNLAELETDVTLLELRRDGLWVYEGCITPAKIKNDFYAIGTGANFAIAAMHMGATPTEAVEIACLYDPSSRGPVDTFKLGRKNAGPS